MDNLQSFFLVEPSSLGLPEQKVLPTEARDPEDELRQRIERSPYTGMGIFRTAPRRVADLWQALAELRIQPKPNGELRAHSHGHVRAVAEVFIHHCRRAIAEDSRLTPSGRQILREAISKTLEGHWELDTRVYAVEPKVGAAFNMKVPTDSTKPAARPGKHAPHLEQRVHADRTNGWRFQVYQPSRERTNVPLEESTTAALLVLHDLLVLPNLGTEGKVLWEEMVRHRHLTWAVPATEWHYDGIKAKISWPYANWSTFREYDFFISHWHKVINWLESSPSEQSKNPLLQLEALAFAWIDLNILTLDRWDTRRVAGFDSNDFTPRWPQLIKNVSGLVTDLYSAPREGRPAKEKKHISQYRALNWVTQLAVFLMPETLGTHNHLRKIIDTHFPPSSKIIRGPRDPEGVKGLKSLYQFWEDKAPEIRDSRAMKLAYLHSTGMAKVAEWQMRAALPACFNSKRHLYAPAPERIRLFLANIESKRQKKVRGEEQDVNHLLEPGTR
jgi:hypothetical protein